MKKKLIIVLFLFAILLGVKNNMTVKAANTYKTINVSDKDVKVGETIFSSTYSEYSGWSVYAEKGGAKKLIDSGTGMSTIILTNGEDVFYDMSSANWDEYIVYQKQIDAESKQRLFSVKTFSFQLCGYWDDKVYYVKELDPGQFCSYSLDTAEINILMNDVTEASQYGQYFITNPYDGAFSIKPLKSYNAAKGKVKVISKKMLSYAVISNKVYYINISPAEMKKFDSGKPYKIDVIRCSLNGKNKKTMLSKRKINGGIGKIGKKSIKYWDKNGKGHTVRYK